MALNWLGNIVNNNSKALYQRRMMVLKLPNQKVRKVHNLKYFNILAKENNFLCPGLLGQFYRHNIEREKNSSEITPQQNSCPLYLKSCVIFSLWN